MAKKRRAVSYYNSIKVDRREWKAEQKEQCCYCLAKIPYDRLEIHEIERKSQAPNRWGLECNYLLLCRTCHAGPFATMPHAKQLAVKLIQNPNDFDLKEWLTIRPRPWSYCTMAEVVQEMRDLL
jgi:hypothetical protein